MERFTTAEELLKATTVQTAVEQYDWRRNFILVIVLIAFTIAIATELASLVRSGVIRF